MLSPVKIATKMKLSQYNFSLPLDLVAKYPAPNRDESRLLVLHKRTGKVENKIFKDVLHYFVSGDVLVLNDTKVFPSRIYGNKEKTGAKIELFLLRELNEDTYLWDVLVEPARKIRIGNKIYFDDEGLVAEVIDNTTSRGRTLRFLYNGDHDAVKQVLKRLGSTPIPKYLLRPTEPDDFKRYQTVIAKNEGTVAAPFAGMHFSRELLKRFEIKGVGLANLTLHLGLGSFRQIDVEDLNKHKTSAEQVIIPPRTADMVNKAKAQNKSICVVGTTSFRALESNVTIQTITPCNKWTNRFFFPPYHPVLPTHLITNFHMPRSMMMMTVSAFAGYDLLIKTYRRAIQDGYKFGCYGDAMLIIDK
jgi:S-adenosylmethionine:tRNA ribosyltransferase-isomerase